MDESPDYRVLDGLLGLDTADAAACERFCETHCLRCARWADGNVRALCDGIRCGLRDPAALEAERAWVLESVAVTAPGGATAAALFAFNRHLVTASPLNAVLGTHHDGTLAMSLTSDGTLHGRLHEVIFGFIAGLGGDLVHANVTKLTSKAGGKLVSDARRMDEAQKKRLGRMMIAQGYSQNQIAKRLGVVRHTVFKWYPDHKW